MKKNTRIRRKKPMVEEIEPRILYSADFAPGVLDSHAVLPQAEQRVLDAGGEFAASAAQTQASAPQSVRHEVVFVDTAVPDYQKLVQDITANSDAQHQYDVVLLKPGADGIKQITQTLSGTHDVSAVHIISHGADGQVELGNTTLNFDSLLKNASQIKSWGQALTSDADVLIYGCDVAEHADGKALINALSRLTGADVAASENLTGAAVEGGDWKLEYSTGGIDTPLAISTAEQFSYSRTLATIQVTNTSDSGAGSLRQAITTANASAGVADTITFNLSTADPNYNAATATWTITVGLAASGNTALPIVTAAGGAVMIDGSTQPGYAGNPLIRIVAGTVTSSAAAARDGLSIAAANSVVRGLAISGFTSDGIQLGGNSITVAGNYIGTNVTGTAAAANGTGININSGTGDIIGSAAAADRNVISGNTTDGIFVNATNSHTILGNFIGTNATATGGIANGRDGIRLSGNSDLSTIGGIAIGAGNVIAFNTGSGVNIITATGDQNAIRGNAIYSNTAGAVTLQGFAQDGATDPDTGANQGQNYPDFSGATVAITGGNLQITGVTLASKASTTYAIDFYAIPASGIGQRYIGTATGIVTNAAGNVTLVPLVFANKGLTAGDRIVATATNTSGAAPELSGTSPFSATSVIVPATGQSISGTIYEDVNGDGSIADGVLRANVTVRLYADNLNNLGNGVPDLLDQLVATTTTNALGVYTFNNVTNGNYFVIVDSKTVTPSTALNGGHVAGETWADETYATANNTAVGTAGAMRAVYYNGGYQFNTATGAFFGGLEGNRSDDGVTLSSTTAGGAEHIQLVSVSNASVTNVNSAYSFNVVTNTQGGNSQDDDPANARTVQGSLRQFIQNANAISGANTMRFVPAVASNQTSGIDAWWQLAVTTALPQITDAGTTVNGTAYSSANGTTVVNSNTGSIGAGGSVGTGADGVTGTGDELALSQVARPELEIRNLAAPLTSNPIGLDVNANNVTIQNLSIWGFGSAAFPADNGNIVVRAVSGATIQNDVIGTSAHDFVDPGTSARSPGPNIVIDASTGALIQNNLIGYSGLEGVRAVNAPSGFQILGNEIRGNGQTNNSLDGIGLVSFAGPGTIQGNLIASNVSPGIDIPNGAGTLLVDQNTITGNAFGAGSEQGGIIARAGASTAISHNVISGNTGSGIIVAGAGVNAQITQNSISGNIGAPGLGIDLVAGAATAGNGVTPNDVGDADTGGNALQNFPVITSASSNGTTVTVSGTLNSNAGGTYTIEFFASPTADASGYGEGQVYLGSTSVLTNGSGNGSFNNVVLNAALTPGWVISATATNAATKQTSEFSTVFVPNSAPIAVNDAYSVNEDSTLVVGAPTTNLANWWKFDDGGASQTVVDSGSLGNNGTRGSTGGVDANDPTWIAGYVGTNALSFDGSSDYVTTTSTVAKTASSFTLSAWFQANTTTGPQILLWEGRSGGNAFGTPSNTPADSEMSLSVGNPNQQNDNITFHLGYDMPGGGADPIYIVSSSTFTDTTAWHNATVTVSDLGGGVFGASLYIDGVLQGSDTGVQNDRSAWGALQIGAPGAASRQFDGKVDDVRVYNAALSPAQVQNVVQAGVLQNDSDADSTPIKVNTSVVTGPANGTLIISPSGSFIYTPNADFNGIDTFTYKATDGLLDSNLATVTITVNPVNDAPTATNLSAAETYTEDTPLNLTDIVVSDVDSANVTAILTLSNVAAGSLTTATSGAVTSTYNAGTGVWTASGALADVNTLLAGVSFTPALNFNSNFTIATSVSDGVAAPITGSKAMTGTPVNDAPTATNLSAAETYTEDTPLNLTDIVVSDVDSANVTAILTLSNVAAGSLTTATSGAVTSTYNAGTGVWTASGALADVNTLLAGVSFTPALNFNSNFTIATSVSDGVAAPITGSKAMTGTPVNDAPTATNLSAAETYTEDTPLNLTDIVVSDVDSANVTAILTLSNVAAGSLTTATSGAVTSTYNAGTGVWTASGALADVNTLLAGVSFTPALNFNSNFTIATSVSDGVAAPITGSKAMTGTPVNDAPTATNLSAAETYTEDTPLNLTDIVVSDVDSANVTAILTLSNVAAGSLTTATSGAVTSTYNAGTGVWTASGALADVNTLLAGVSFTPALNFNSNFTIATSVSDGVAAPITGSKAMTGTPVNDAPTATNLSAAETYTEDTPLNLTDIVVSDVDSANVTAILTLSNVAAGSLTTATSGAVTSTYNAGTGVWTASGALADVNTLLAGVSFTPALNFNSNFTIATSVSDGVAAPITGSKAMTGTPVNDAPTATNLSAAETYTEDTPLNLTDIVVSDVDSANVTAILTLSNVAAGSLTTATSGAVTSTYNAGTGVWTASGALADVNTLLAGVSFTPALNFNSNFTIATSVSDGVAAPITGSKAMTGTPVNDAPTATNLSAAETYTEDTPLNLTDIVVSDVDSANVTAILTLSNVAAGSLTTATSGAVTSTYNAGTGVWTASGALADVNTLLAGVSFTPALNFNSNFTIATSVSDGVAAPITGSKAMTGTPVNDAPVVSAGGSTGFTENTAAVVIDNTITIADVDDTQLSGATVTISAGLTAGDVLGFTNTASISGSYNAGTGVLTLSGTDSLANYQAALRSVTYSSASDDPTNNATAPSRTLAWQVTDANSDGTGAQSSAVVTSTINVSAVNDAPVMSAGATTGYTENAPAVVIDNTITIADVDDTQLSGATVTISAGLTAGDVLGFTNTASISGSYNAGTGVLTLSGTDSLANYQAALRSVTYSSASDDPTNNATAPSRTLAWRVTDANSDGTGAQSSAVVTSTVNVTAVNDAPVVAAGASVGYMENAVAVTADAGLTLADVDDTQIAGATVTISAGLTAGDVLGFTNTASISGSYNAGTGVLTLSGTDTLANYQAALRSVTYSSTSDDPTSNATAPSRTLAWQVTDANSDGTGAQSSAVVTSTINVSAVNDAPVMSAGATTGYTENAPAVVIDNTITIADVDDTQLSGATVTISAGLTAGDVLGFTNTASISGSYNAGTGVLTLSGTDSLANYQAALRSVTYSSTSDDPTSNATAPSRTLAWQVTDANSDGVGAANSAAVTSTINVTAVNDAPVLATGSVLAYTENQAATAINTLVTVNDVDNTTLASATVSITGNFASGEDVLGFVNNPATMGNIAGAYNAATGVMSLSSAGASATLAQWQAALQSVSYSNSSDNPSVAPRTVSYTVNDAAANSNTITSTINVTAVNDAPVLATGSVLAYTENQAATAINTLVTVNDVDNTTLASATVSITGNFASGEDVLGFVNNPATMGNIAGAYNAATGVMSLSSAGASATLAQWQAALQSVSYSNSSDNPSVAPRTVSYTVNDAAANSNTITSTINVTAVNDAPVLATGSVLAYTENQAATAINTLVTVNDVDNTTLASATVSITGNFASGEDVLGFVNNPATMGNIAGAYNAATGVMSLSSAGASATLAQWQAALQSVSYSNSSDNPSVAPRTVSYTVNDAAANSNTITSTINVTAVNDAPVLATGSVLAYTENQAATAINTVITTADLDNATLASATVSITTNFTAGQDVLGFTNVPATMGNIAGAYNAVSGVMTLTSAGSTATLAQWQTALQAVTYSNSSDNPSVAPRTVSYTVNDTAANSNTITSTINVTAVNDAPVLGNDTLTIVRGGSVILSGANLSASDVDNVAAGLSFTVSNVLDGQFELVSTPGVAVTNFTQGAIAGGQVRFVHDGSINPPAFDLTVSDGTLSAGPTAATIAFSVPATGGPIIAPPAPTPPAPPTSNPGSTPPAPPPPAAQPAQPVVTPVVTLSGGLPMAPEPVGVELFEPIRGANPFLQVDGRLKPNLNPAPLIKPAEQTLLIAGTDPQYMEFGPLTKVDWSAQSAFPSADRNPSEHDQIQVIMESVRMGGIALSVGVVWWASRVTGLIGSLLASMPAWRQLDPLPIVGRDEEEDRWDETGDSEADADELAISMVLEGPRSREAVSA